MWYGLLVNGELEYVIKWGYYGKPIVSDFNISAINDNVYEVVWVDVSLRF